MSQLIVRVSLVEEIQPIPDSDRIEHVRVGNWWSVCRKGYFQIGEKVLYVPPEVVIPKELGETWGISAYCAELPKRYIAEVRSGLRVKASRIRGVSSFGTIQKLSDQTLEVGTNLAEQLNITKYNPLTSCLENDIGDHNPLFIFYSSIEHLGNFPSVISEGEEVFVTEKIHGSNCRIGLLVDSNEFEVKKWNLYVGSHEVSRVEYDTKGKRSRYWEPLSLDPSECKLRKMLASVCSEMNANFSVIVYGEIYGYGIQDMHYGTDEPKFVAYDICVDGKFMSCSDALNYFKRFDIDVPPLLYNGPFSLKKMDSLVDGPSVLCKPENNRQPFKGREGIVIKPAIEKVSAEMNGRVVLKYISVDYYTRMNSNRTEFH